MESGRSGLPGVRAHLHAMKVASFELVRVMDRFTAAVSVLAMTPRNRRVN